MLFDFYAPLLTEKQSRTWDSYYLKNLSLAEVAREQGTSRQAVHSLLQRTLESLEMYEEKLKLIERFFVSKDFLMQADQRLHTMLAQERVAQASVVCEILEVRTLLRKALDTY
ncbi:MAG: hypothetical protein FWG40_09755 [Peptococcaceae bacterium]|nr:hypothetical protein [Peptococcaceae bacterium]